MAHTPLVSRIPGHHASGDIAVQFLTSAEEFARLAPDWNRIHGAAAAASVFNSWVWQYQWWQVYGGGQPLRILVALEHGETLGILALYIQTIQVLGVPVRLLRFVGTGADTHPDDVGPVLAHEAGGGSESFATPQYIDFHRSIMKATLPRGWLRLYCLELDDELSAITYCYRFRNRVYLMQAGFDPARARLNPGRVLLGYALEHAIGEGNEVFDFLRGEHRYKDQLATGHRNTMSVRVFRTSPGAFAYRLRRIWLP